MPWLVEHRRDDRLRRIFLHQVARARHPDQLAVCDAIGERLPLFERNPRVVLAHTMRTGKSGGA